MKHLQLLPIGKLDGGLLMELAPAVADTFRMPCEILSRALDPEFAFHGERQQYHSSEILQRMQSFLAPNSWRVLGVAAVDLYIPILTFVFGEAQVGGPCAVVSLHRLRQEFYGLPEDQEILRYRLAKEAVHEIVKILATAKEATKDSRASIERLGRVFIFSSEEIPMHTPILLGVD